MTSLRSLLRRISPGPAPAAGPAEPRAALDGAVPVDAGTHRSPTGRMPVDERQAAPWSGSGSTGPAGRAAGAGAGSPRPPAGSSDARASRLAAADPAAPGGVETRRAYRVIEAAGARAEEVSDADFRKFQALIQRVAGIHLAPCKKALLAGRLSRRMREMGIDSLARYYRAVEADPAELTRMLDAVSTNETHFFREPAHFDLLEHRVLPALRAEADAGLRQRRIRVWSAACSTGQEPYTLAMVLLHALEGWDVEILASDISNRALERARQAVWPMALAREIPDRYRRAYMLRGTGSAEGTMKAGPEIRGVVRFARLNLNDADAYPGGRFDLVFCRNVLIYFEPHTRRDVVHRLLDRLTPGGLLFVGHAESLVNATRRVRAVAPTVYAAEDAADASAGTAR